MSDIANIKAKITAAAATKANWQSLSAGTQVAKRYGETVARLNPEVNMTFLYIFSISLTVISNVAYHFCQKEISGTANPLISLFFTYFTGMVVTVVCFPVFYPNVNLLESVKTLNWATFGLGVAIVGLELGFLLAYRAGWNISIAALYSNVMVTVVLLPVGLFFYRDSLNLKHALGILFSLCGIVLLSKK